MSISNLKMYGIILDQVSVEDFGFPRVSGIMEMLGKIRKYLLKILYKLNILLQIN